jgi:MerR family mercuric resistance operon transcriptional regulator
MAEEKITLIEDKIKDLEQMKNILVDLTDDCIKTKDSDNCPIIDIIIKTPRKAPSITEQNETYLRVNHLKLRC